MSNYNDKILTTVDNLSTCGLIGVYLKKRHFNLKLFDMKKTFFKLAHLWVVCALLLAFVWGFSHIFTLDFKIQMMIIGFVLAPISEELLYRWLPVQLEKRFIKLGWIPGVLANFLFIAIHKDNYPYAGIYWAFAIQGMMGFCCLFVMRRYGYWSAVFLHAKFNLGVHFLL